MIYTLSQVIDNRRDWYTALTSGEFSQGHIRLVTPTDKGLKYCCLGVAYESCKNFPYEIEKVNHPKTCAFTLRYEYNGKSTSFLADTTLEKKMRQYLGLSHETENLLISLNDTHNVSFDGIAQVISFLPVCLYGDSERVEKTVVLTNLQASIITGLVR